MIHTVLRLVQLDRFTAIHHKLIALNLPVEHPCVGEDAVGHFRAPDPVRPKDQCVPVPPAALAAPDACEVGRVKGQLTDRHSTAGRINKGKAASSIETLI